MDNTDTVQENGNGNHRTEGSSIEAHLSAMDSPTKPWYLSTKAIFRVVNKAAAAIPSNQPVFDQSTFGLNELTKLIHEKTLAKQLVINFGKAQSLIDKLDQIRSDQFTISNDGHDHQRNILSSSLRSLIACIAEQQKLADDFLSEKAASAQSMSDGPEVAAATATMSSITQQITELAASLSEELNTKYPDAFVRATASLKKTLREVEDRKASILSKTTEWQSYCSELLNMSNNKILIRTVQMLKSAQPYAQLAYNRSAPVVTTITQWSQPYMKVAMPLLEPVLVRMKQTQITLQQSSITGPVLTKTMDQAILLLELAKLYCAAPNPDIAVAALVATAEEIPEVPNLDGVAAEVSMNVTL